MIPRWESAWIAHRARETPDAEAVAWPVAGRDSSAVATADAAGGNATLASISYRELGVEAERAADALRALGLRPADVVGVLLPNSAACVVLIHALQLVGAVLLPINGRLTRSEIAPQLLEAGARFFVHAPEDSRGAPLLVDLPELRGIEFSSRSGVDFDLRAAEPATGANEASGHAAQAVAAPEAGPDAESPLALLFTSGTTGMPRAAALSAANFWHAADASAERLGAEAEDRWLACMPLFHVGGLSIVYRSVLAGTSLLVHEGFDAGAVARELDADRVTLVSFVATMLERVLDARADRRSPRRLRAVLLGGGPAAPALIARAQALGYPVAPTYGLTEACSQVATWPARDGREAYAGRVPPLRGTELRIVDAQGAVLPAGGEGEIEVRGPTVMRGYWKRPDETREALRNGWLRTGDIGSVDGAGWLQVLDRRSDLIVSGGENIYPAEVEAVLLDHPDVREAGVVGVADVEFGSRPVACIVAASADRDAQAILDHCRKQLAPYKVPLRIEWCDALPRTAAGKLQRAVLRERLGSAVRTAGA